MSTLDDTYKALRCTKVEITFRDHNRFIIDGIEKGPYLNFDDCIFDGVNRIAGYTQENDPYDSDELYENSKFCKLHLWVKTNVMRAARFKGSYYKHFTFTIDPILGCIEVEDGMNHMFVIS